MTLEKKDLRNKMAFLLEQNEVRRTLLDKEIEWHIKNISMVANGFGDFFISGMEHARNIIDGAFQNMKHVDLCKSENPSSSSLKQEPTPTSSLSPSEGLGQNY